ncbi:MAG: dTDP-4-dehydrorhamnose reductase [Xanthobacteraceae bacterium]|nr:dTDP-4-dehydrorhamnose reductase [Xanthobacteraceae bacterium]
MKVLVIGSDGQVARALRDVAGENGDVLLSCTSRSEVDVRQRDDIARAVEAARPDVIVNPAAFTAVDQAESQSELAFAINRDGARNVASVAARHAIPLIHLSTDYVFDGEKDGAYLESDATNPQTVYGASKLAGERAIAEVHPRSIVLRTAWVYAPYGSNFVRTMVRLAARNQPLRVVEDQVGCPTYAPDLARTILAMIAHAEKIGWPERLFGVLHACGADRTSWFGFARQVMTLSEAAGGPLVHIDPIPTSEYPTPARRPRNSTLSCERLKAQFGLALPPLAPSLGACIHQLRESGALEAGS